MPYILSSKKIENSLLKSKGETPKMAVAGELNYELTMLCLEYLAQNGKCYATMNDIVGALDSCKMEFYRRVVEPYEDVKIKENGDVY